jgi:RNA polymerase sigma-70 factor (ECF subfamily)
VAFGNGTSIVHEAYLRLVEERSVDWQGRSHFFSVAAMLMRRVLVDHARSHVAAKRGGGLSRVPLTDTIAMRGSARPTCWRSTRG